MLGFLKKLFGTKPTVNPCAEAPYKVETPAATPSSTTNPQSDWPFPKSVSENVSEEKPKKKPAAKKPAGEKKPAVKAKSVKAKKKSS